MKAWYVVTLLFCGCNLPQTWETAQRFEPPQLDETFGTSVEGRVLRGAVVGKGAETVLLVGVVHGNEPLGKPLLERFLRHLEAHPELEEGKRLVIIPVANPDGLARKTRTNARGVDLNRNFPSRSWRPGLRNGSAGASEPETRALLKVVRQFQPSRILAVHSPLELVNFDGPADDLAAEIARVCKYPVRESVGYPTPGSFGSYTGEDWDTPTITLELGEDVTTKDLWARFGPALEVFVRYPNHDTPGNESGIATTTHSTAASGRTRSQP